MQNLGLGIKDFNGYIAGLLKPLCRVETVFPSAIADFPVIIITEIANTSSLILDRNERISDVSFQLDIWDNKNDRERTEEISIMVDAVMLEAGFRRTFGQAVMEKRLQRKCLRYSGRIDLVNFRVYEK